MEPLADIKHTAVTNNNWFTESLERNRISKFNRELLKVLKVSHMYSNLNDYNNITLSTARCASDVHTSSLASASADLKISVACFVI